VRLSAHGLDVDVPPGWEGRIMRREVTAFGERPRPVVHIANFALPEERGDFGAGVVDAMHRGDMFVVMFEYGPESVGQPLFRHQGVPQLSPKHFSARRLQRVLPGQVGAQLFFTAANRAFCLYVVLAGPRDVRYSAGQVNAAINGFGIAPR
jgi:hypothetical protein